MINVFEALSWLSAIDGCSYLSGESRWLIDSARRFDRSDSKVQRILHRLRNAAYSSGNPSTKAELLLYCAAISSWRGCFSEAACDASEAAITYDEDDHRQAVALWIEGMAQWKMFQNHQAYKNWSDARKMFQRRQILFQNFPDEKNWYKDKIRRMDVELAKRPEEIWTWLHEFERSWLCSPTKQVVDGVQERVKGREYSNVYALIQDLQEANRSCQGVYERAEIFLEFGLAIYEMENTHFAMELLRKSVLHFFPGAGIYHKQVVARCMLGAVEWMDKLSHNQAEADWARCIEEFDRLRQWAERDNDSRKRDWYAEHRDILKEALLDQLRRGTKPAPPPVADPDMTPEDPPKPPESGPSQGNGYSYEDLLSMVGREDTVAERLIELERKKLPDADRPEWIKRAIERLIRDRQ